jgi:hypothetical protein
MIPKAGRPYHDSNGSAGNARMLYFASEEPPSFGRMFIGLNFYAAWRQLAAKWRTLIGTSCQWSVVVESCRKFIVFQVTRSAGESVTEESTGPPVAGRPSLRLTVWRLRAPRHSPACRLSPHQGMMSIRLLSLPQFAHVLGRLEFKSLKTIVKCIDHEA